MGGAISLIIILFCFWLLRKSQKHMKSHLIADSFHGKGGIDVQ